MITDELVDEAPRKLARAKDTVIGQAIDLYLGYRNWNINQLATRMTREIHFDEAGREAFEIWRLDGVSIIKIMPLEYETMVEGYHTKMVCKFKHQFITYHGNSSQPTPEKPVQG